MSAVEKIKELNMELLKIIDNGDVSEDEILAYRNKLIEIVKSEYLNELNKAVEEYVNKMLEELWDIVRRKCKSMICMCEKIRRIRKIMKEIEEDLKGEINYLKSERWW
jgi:hypothetical protein